MARDPLTDLLIQSIQQSKYNNNGSMGINVAPRQTPPDLTMALQGKTPQNMTPIQFDPGTADPMTLQDTTQTIDPSSLSGKIQEWLGAKEPTSGGLVEQLLSNRTRPGLKDWGDALAQTVNKGTLVTPDEVSQGSILDRLKVAAELQKAQTMGTGGATGALIQQYMDSTGADFPTALYAVQTGLRQGLQYQNGQISPLPGVPEAQGAIQFGKQSGNQQAILGSAQDIAAAKEVGQNQGQKQFDLPRVKQNVNYWSGLIDSLSTNPGLPYLVGGLGSLAPIVPGTPQADAKAILDQLSGSAFLQAFDTLRGGGQISNVEGDKATQAIARLQRTQSLPGFQASLRELKDILNKGLQRSAEQAGQPVMEDSNDMGQDDPLGIR